MIDIEDKVIDTVCNALTTASITATVSSEYVETLSSLPHVYIQEISNATYQKTQDGSLTEHHARIQFKVECYANTKQEAKNICNIVDNAMQSMKFTRTSYSFLPNYDRHVARVMTEYYAIVEEPSTTTSEGVTTETYRIYRN